MDKSQLVEQEKNFEVVVERAKELGMGVDDYIQRAETWNNFNHRRRTGFYEIEIRKLQLARSGMFDDVPKYVEEARRNIEVLTKSWAILNGSVGSDGHGVSNQLMAAISEQLRVIHKLVVLANSVHIPTVDLSEALVTKA